MRLQDTPAGCGPAAMSNALSAMGIRRPQSECEVLCGTTGTDGTPPARLFRAIGSVDGLAPVRVDETRADVAVLRLFAALTMGVPALLLVDQDEHWIAAVGLLGSRILVADSADSDLVLSYSKAELVDRWRGVGRRPFYGVLLTEAE